LRELRKKMSFRMSEVKNLKAPAFGYKEILRQAQDDNALKCHSERGKRSDHLKKYS
jgi:hypothetical protein